MPIRAHGISGNPLEECFVLSGGGFESLAAIADVEKAAADNAKTIAKNTLLTCFIICYLLNCDSLSLLLQHPLLQILNVIHYYQVSK